MVFYGNCQKSCILQGAFACILFGKTFTFLSANALERIILIRVYSCEFVVRISSRELAKHEKKAALDGSGL